jgi:nitroreductase
MQRQVPAKIPLVEEIAATAAAIQNILLGAEALGISVLWSTGGMTHHPALKSFWGLAEEDVVMGLLYLGYTNEPSAAGKRNGTAAEKTSWIK